MKAFDGIKEKAGLRALRKEVGAQKRRVKPCNYGMAQSVCILYDGTTKSTHEAAKKFVRYLKEEEGIRKIKAFAYFPEKEEPEYLQAKLDFDFFTKKDLNWQQMPGGTTVDNFINEEHDILIDLTNGDILPLLFVLVRSKASFKVGPRKGLLGEYYDLMIALDQKASMEEFIAQTNHFLKLLNRASA